MKQKFRYRAGDVVRLLNDNHGGPHGPIAEEEPSLSRPRRITDVGNGYVQVESFYHGRHEWFMSTKNVQFIGRYDKNGRLRGADGKFINGKQVALHKGTTAVKKAVPADNPAEFDAYLEQKRVEFRQAVGDKHSCCHFMYVGIREDGKFASEKQVAAACYANMSYPSLARKATKYIVDDVAAHAVKMRVRGLEKEYHRAGQWFIRDSKFAPNYITKDWKEALEKGIVVDATLPANVIFTSLVALREMSEYPERLRSWIALVDNGIEPNIAFFLCHSVALTKGGDFTTVVNGDAHGTFGTYGVDFKHIKAFCKTGAFKEHTGAYNQGGKIGSNAYFVHGTTNLTGLLDKNVKKKREGTFGATIDIVDIEAIKAAVKEILK